MNEENVIEKKLGECNIEVQYRFNYIDNQCCEVEDEQLEIIQEIEELNVELEIAKRMSNDEEAKQIEQAIKEDGSYLEYLYEREEILEDLWEEELSKILLD